MTYRVRETERAEGERDRAFFQILASVGPDFANAWYTGLLSAIADLANFPGPYANVRDEIASEHYGYAVRRLLYTGPLRRKSRVGYRVLYTVLGLDAEDGTSTILILRVLHGARFLDTPDT